MCVLSGTKLASQNCSDHGGRERARNHSAAGPVVVFADRGEGRKAARENMGTHIHTHTKKHTHTHTHTHTLCTAPQQERASSLKNSCLFIAKTPDRKTDRFRVVNYTKPSAETPTSRAKCFRIRSRQTNDPKKTWQRQTKQEGRNPNNSKPKNEQHLPLPKTKDDSCQGVDVFSTSFYSRTYVAFHAKHNRAREQKIEREREKERENESGKTDRVTEQDRQGNPATRKRQARGKGEEGEGQHEGATQGPPPTRKPGKQTFQPKPGQHTGGRKGGGDKNLDDRGVDEISAGDRGQDDTQGKPETQTEFWVSQHLKRIERERERDRESSDVGKQRNPTKKTGNTMYTEQRAKLKRLNKLTSTIPHT